TQGEPDLLARGGQQGVGVPAAQLLEVTPLERDGVVLARRAVSPAVEHDQEQRAMLHPVASRPPVARPRADSPGRDPDAILAGAGPGGAAALRRGSGTRRRARRAGERATRPTEMAMQGTMGARSYPKERRVRWLAAGLMAWGAACQTTPVT